ncbi:helix-turn-helix transcriptional regulator [Salmonella enterica]|uniref:Transcriptional regulator n=3 Tax=Salmonella enterica I TaxID=59201 RepID=A0A5V0BC41_SALEN|nr:MULTISPECIES: helix-turn-helix domain-containing protein [Salmonella]AZT32711.1 transcriptional regulator [Salmonella enterica subsp. enterica serovar Stanleyville]EAB5866679.1 transcriptional regulator [Salmonella enterica subsp. enterica serovar Cairina]EBG8067570.1 helix-turn-helix transcriptional regulator [Salmonella enterica subsp. enterica serovar Elisabethville]EBQ9464559.1 transcriptional regulator [Salmonella enterica subsp. enterica serovar Wangata]EBS5460128.1 transcriptional re
MMAETCSQTGINLEETDFGYTLSLISGKYKMIVMYWLNENKPVMRYNELKRRIGTISFKTLSNTLKELEQDGIINRVEYPQIPPKVEYSLSKRGESLMPILDLMCDWGGKNRN